MSTPVLTCKIGHKWTAEMKYSKGKKGSRILTHNGTKKTATNLFVLFSEEWNKKETTIPLQEQKKKIIISEWFPFVYDTRRFDKTWSHEDHLENNDYDENHGSEAPDDDSDDKRHGWRHTWQLCNIAKLHWHHNRRVFFLWFCFWCFLAAHGVSCFVLS